MKKGKIIIQDSDKDILDILRIILEEENYEVLTLTDCLNILHSISEFNPQILLLDFRISGRECIKACQEVKAFYPNLPIIALSCNWHIKDTYRLHGFDNYVLKPFDIVDLCRKIEVYFAKQSI